MIKDLVKQWDWMAKVDLKDAYFLIPIYPDHQKYLRFQWKGQTYQFHCLPFGLSCAPRVFTKVLKPVVAFLRERGVQLIIYLDNILILSTDQLKLKAFSHLNQFECAFNSLQAISHCNSYQRLGVLKYSQLPFVSHDNHA